MIKPETHFGKNIVPIFQAMNETYPIVVDYIREGRRSDGHVTGSANFNNIADNVVKLFDDMDLDIFHLSCLRSWSQREQTCFACRTPILRLSQTTPPPAAPNPAPAAQAPAAGLNPQAAANAANAAPPAGAQSRTQTLNNKLNNMRITDKGRKAYEQPLPALPSSSEFSAVEVDVPASATSTSKLVKPSPVLPKDKNKGK